MTLRSSLGYLLCATLVLPGILASPVLAQSSPGFSQLDVRPPDAAASLNASLTRLGENPRDISALIGAGEAALDLDDPRAATGFFARADEIESGNGRIKAGLGLAMLQLQNPTEALRLFDQAERLRYPVDNFASDRGLARDLMGDQAGAQRDYQLALKTKPDDAELIRRYAVSLGISGQVEASEKVIEPLLYKNDRAAWRNRAFVLAMNGREQQARNITQKVMPQPLADAIQPYMERMTGLSAAQKAAAVHFGSFPANSGVRMAANNATAPRVVTPTPAQVPSATAPVVVPAPPSRNVVKAQPQVASKPAPKADAMPTLTQANVIPPKPVVVQPAPAPTPTPTTTPARSQPAVQGPVDPSPMRSTAPVFAAQDTPVPPAQIAPQPQVPVSQPQPTSVPTARTAPDPSATRTLADIIRELDVPDSEKQTDVAAVDLTEIAAIQAQKREAARVAADKAKRDAAAKAKVEADAKAKALAAEKAKLAKNPSRNWVQIGTGQSISALGFTLRGLRKKHDSLAGKSAFTASWGRTNRLVVGPFSSFTKAKDFEATLKKGGADVFAWKSDAGEEVVPVAGN